MLSVRLSVFRSFDILFNDDRWSVQINRHAAGGTCALTEARCGNATSAYYDRFI